MTKNTSIVVNINNLTMNTDRFERLGALEREIISYRIGGIVIVD